MGSQGAIRTICEPPFVVGAGAAAGPDGQTPRCLAPGPGLTPTSRPVCSSWPRSQVTATWAAAPQSRYQAALLAVDVEHGHRSPRLGEAPSGRRPRSRRGTRDDGDLAMQLHDASLPAIGATLVVVVVAAGKAWIQSRADGSAQTGGGRTAHAVDTTRVEPAGTSTDHRPSSRRMRSAG